MSRVGNGGEGPNGAFARVVVAVFVGVLVILLAALVVVELGWIPR